MTASNDDRVLFEIDAGKRIATITLNNPKQRNSYDAGMREAVGRCLDRVADDDDLTVVLLRGAEGVFFHRGRHEQRIRLVWRQVQGARCGQAATQPAQTTYGGPQVI